MIENENRAQENEQEKRRSLKQPPKSESQESQSLSEDLIKKLNVQDNDPISQTDENLTWLL